MAVDLADYSGAIKAALRKGGFACVYVATVTGGELSRVGYAEDLTAAVSRLQRASPVPLSVEGAIWVPDRGIATNIAKSVQCDLAGSRKAGGWYGVAAVTAMQAVELAAVRLYPGATIVAHDQLISQWKAKRAA